MAITFYERRLLNEPEITKELQNIFWGIEETHNVTLEFSNTDGFFSSLLAAGEEFRGIGIKIRRYEPNEVIPDDIITFELYGIVCDFNILVDKAVFEISISLTDPVLQDLIPKKVYETTDYAETPPLIINPPFDLGKPYNICFGNCKKVPLLYVHANYTLDQYDYIIGYGIIEGIDYVYRSKVLVSPAEYTFFDGSVNPDNPYPGFAFIRFSLEQRDFNGSMYEISADVRGLELGGSVAERNTVNIIKNILTNTTWGLSQSIDSTSFQVAFSKVTNLFSDGFIQGQNRAYDVLNEILRICRGKLYKNSSGQWGIIVNYYESKTAATFGSNDGWYNNIISISKNKNPSINESIKKIIVKYSWNEWTGEYEHVNQRGIFRIPYQSAMGEELVIECPFIRDHQTADRMVCFIENMQIYAARKIGITVGMEARQLKEGDVIELKIPELYIDALFQIENITRSINTYMIECCSYSQSIYIYNPGSMPNDPNPDNEPDYRHTPPSTPTSFQKVSQDTYQSTDGTTFAYFNVSAVAPSANFAKMIFGYKRTGETYYSYVDGNKPVAGSTWSGRIDGLVPGLYYDLAAISANIFNLMSIPATLSSQLAPGDTTTPAQVTGMVGSGKYKTWQWTWTKNSEDDLKGYHVQICTNSGFTSGIIFDKNVGANAVSFTDDARAYSTLYCRVKAVDFTGNESASWSATSSATTQQTLEDDLADGSVSSLKVQDLAVTNAKIANLAVTNAKIANLAVDNAKIANLAVNSLKLSDNAVTYLKRQLVEEQSTTMNIPPGITYTYPFTHNYGRKVLNTPIFAFSSVDKLPHYITQNNGNNAFDIVVYNPSTTTTITGTLYVSYW